MTRTLLATVVLAGAAAVAVGCSSNTSQPYSLTGESQASIDQQHEEWAWKQHYTDDKGRYHPELVEWNTSVK